jgi:hypothetical protein
MASGCRRYRLLVLMLVKAQKIVGGGKRAGCEHIQAGKVTQTGGMGEVREVTKCICRDGAP